MSFKTTFISFAICLANADNCAGFAAFISTNTHLSIKPLSSSDMLLVVSTKIALCVKPLTPAKARIDALNKQKDRANDALKAERARQKQANAVQRVQSAQQALVKARLK